MVKSITKIINMISWMNMMRWISIQKKLASKEIAMMTKIENIFKVVKESHVINNDLIYCFLFLFFNCTQIY